MDSNYLPLLKSHSRKYPESRSQRFREVGARTCSPTEIKDTVQRVEITNMRVRSAAVCERTKAWFLLAIIPKYSCVAC